MIVWINGAFGAGKTQTAFALHRRLPDAFVFDPEHAGYYIRGNVPKASAQADFQDYPMWRDFNVAMLRHIDRTYDGVVLAPMTLVQPLYFEEIVGRLRADGVDVRHFALQLPKEEVLRRLRTRGEGARSWAARQADRCVASLADERFGVHLDAAKLSIDETAERIASLAGLPLQPDRRSKLRKLSDRLLTQLKHIRF